MTTYRVLPKTDQLPYALYRAQQVRDLEQIAIQQYQLSGEELMARAGAAVFTLLQHKWPGKKRITVVCGVGNNGGDGYVIAKLAQQAGYQVQLILLADIAQVRGDALTHLQHFQECGGTIAKTDVIAPDTSIIVDALLGTGLARNVDGQYADLIRQINQHTASVVAVDIPSGLDADTGWIMGSAVFADVCVSFIGLKQGMFTGQGADCCGEIYFDTLAVPARIYASEVLAARRVDWAKVANLMPRLKASAHKGDRGHVLVVGGDVGYAGAALLAAESALRAGAGLVTLATRQAHVPAVLAARPEIMAVGIEKAGELKALIEKADVIAIGPGLGQQQWGQSLWQTVLAADLPLVVDADALNLLSRQPAPLKQPAVITPHPGEAARLLEIQTAQIQADRFQAASRLQQRFNCVAVLKGSGTLIDGCTTAPVAVCSDGNPGMASGGMGDLLTGIIASLLAQGLDLNDAAVAGVCLHAASAAAAASDGEKGMLASDLFPYIRKLVNKI